MFSFIWGHNKPEISLRNPKLSEVSFEPGLRPHNAPIGREQIHHIGVNLEDRAVENRGRVVDVLMAHPLNSVSVGLEKPGIGQPSFWLSIPAQWTVKKRQGDVFDTSTLQRSSHLWWKWSPWDGKSKELEDDLDDYLSVNFALAPCALRGPPTDSISGKFFKNVTQHPQICLLVYTILVCTFQWNKSNIDSKNHLGEHIADSW